MIRKSYKINAFIEVMLNDSEIKILIKGEEFMICKGIIIETPSINLNEVENIYSIDDLVNKYGEIDNKSKTDLTLETQFLVHCSNLQAWEENGYDTILLHSNLSFPLLKRLSEEGDPQAKKRFKEEIVKRYLEGNAQVQKFLAIEGYLSLLTSEEAESLLKKNLEELHEIESIIGRKLKIGSDILLGHDLELGDGEITGLRLYGKENIDIPNQIGLIKSLKRLDLNQFNDIEIPCFISKLFNLEYLDLSNNKIEIIQEDFGNLINLEFLDLGYNQLKNLPNSFIKLRNLKKISLNKNNFEAFPKELFSLTSLQIINLSNNNIKTIPVDIQRLRNLYELIIRNNPIRSIPHELFSLPKLESISLHNCNIEITNDIKKIIKNRDTPLKIYPHKLIGEP